MNGKWISVKDALPATRSFVLVINPYSGPYDNENVVWWCLYHDGKFYDVGKDRRYDEEMKVSHWMKPPEIEDEYQWEDRDEEYPVG